MLHAVATLASRAPLWIEILMHMPGGPARLVHRVAVIKRTFSGGRLETIVLVINVCRPPSAAHLSLLWLIGSYFILNGWNLRSPQSLPRSSSNSSFKFQAF